MSDKMFQLDGLRTQAQVHAYIARRDLPKRFVTVQFLLVAIWLTGAPGYAFANFMWLVFIEAALLWLIWTHPKVTEIGWIRISALLITSVLVSVGYYVPGVVLALQPDYGLAVGGIAWILAAISTNLVMYNALRAFYWTTAVAGFPAALAVVFLGGGVAVEPAGPYSWLLPTSIILLYIVNTLQQLWEYRDTHNELEKTRAELLKSMRQLEYMSEHDGLTGLGNRVAFTEDLNRMIAQTPPKQCLGLFMIDLNGFKPINDTYGHAAGDAILQNTAKRLSSELRPGAAAYRLGGDEFVVLSYVGDKDAAQMLGDRLADKIRNPLQYDKHTLLLGASIGVALSTSKDQKPEDLCAMADHAMYEAKARLDKTALISTGLQPAETADPGLRNDVRRALEQNLIEPFYQERFDLKTGKSVGVQALARWISDDKQIRLPEEFLPELEAINLLPELTYTILRHVLADITHWKKCGHDPGRVSLNMPAVVLSTQTSCEQIAWLMAEHPGAEQHLAFEITETALTSRSAPIIAENLQRFLEAGVEIHLDDFGTGLASYQHLRKTTPHHIKLDGSLIKSMHPGAPALTIVEGLIRIAHGLGAQVIAENVETEFQAKTLKDLNCDYAEGFFFSNIKTNAELTAQVQKTAEL